jgi:2OG-Fe(II) oxygenase superfamily
MTAIDRFFADGYTLLKLSDVCTDIDRFDTEASKAMSIPVDNQSYTYVLSVHGKHGDPEWPFRIPIDQIDVVKRKMQEQNLRATQQWYESSFNVDRKKFFRELVNSFIRQYYPEIKEDFSNLHHQDAFTLYKKGDFSENHRDGQNLGRLCVVLIYLTEEKYYNTAGGILTISGDHQTDKNPLAVKPVRGNIAMIDFTRHNPFHEVRLVTEDFDRHCYTAFLWNLDKIPDENKP